MSQIIVSGFYTNCFNSKKLYMWFQLSKMEKARGQKNVTTMLHKTPSFK